VNVVNPFGVMVFVSDFCAFPVHPSAKQMNTEIRYDRRTKEGQRLHKLREEYTLHMNGIATVAVKLGLDGPRELFPE